MTSLSCHYLIKLNAYGHLALLCLWLAGCQSPKPVLPATPPAIQPATVTEMPQKQTSPTKLPIQKPASASRALEAHDPIQNWQLKQTTQAHLQGLGLFWVKPATLNIRNGPSLHHSRVGVLKQGQRVQALEILGKWIRIEADQWVARQHLQPHTSF